MKQRLNIALTTRLNVLLCSSAAVLLAACGGASDGSTGPATQTAAYVDTNAGAGQTSEPNAADAGAATGSGAASNDFALAGYDTNPLAGAGSINGALILLWECFGLQGMESITALQSLRSRLTATT